MLEAASVRKAENASRTPAFERQLLASTGMSALPASNEVPASIADNAPEARVVDKTAETYQRFEAMILQKFIGSMLPQDSEELYGKGTAGEIWKGMMAEQLGMVLAKGGGIGIADRMLEDRIGVAPESADAIDSNVTNRAANMINQFQMQILADVNGSDASDAANDTNRSTAWRA
ncbi:Rod binding protein [Hoeflea phototrophica DFL-43]|uniref:Rod binding protein n=2 Tax=Hoeflea TaxID=274591 RepID=A9CYQ8_HOEPD|nr:Rod binding protein [Hoeflea phototrophica DFL-43]